jgi:hypothetical protein
MKMKTKIARLIIAFFIATICRSVYAGDFQDVSVIQLISTPELFDGQSVRVIGFLHLEFEGDAVYVHRDDFDHLIEKNSVAVELSDAQARTWGKLNNHYVIIEGRFSSNAKGHLGARSGSLQNLTRLGDWPASRVRNKASGR